MKDLIRALTELYGPSGSEEQVREHIRGIVAPLVDETRVDALGNLIALRKGTGSGARIMLAAHMDEIGLIVTYEDDKGFLRFGGIGGLHTLALSGSRVRFANNVIGTIGLEKLDSTDKIPGLDKMYLDVGAQDRDSLPVHVGDVACFDRAFVAQGKRLMAKAMDDRVGCAVLIEVLRKLGSTPHDVFAVFTVQEEVGLRGARTSAYGVEPDLAIAVDGTFTGDTPEARPMAVALGKGPAIKVKDRGMLAHRWVKDLLVKTAERAGIPYQMEVFELGTTDAYAIQVSRSGVPTGALSIPARYVHTASEMIDYRDVVNGVELLRGLLSGPIEFE